MHVIRSRASLCVVALIVALTVGPQVEAKGRACPPMPATTQASPDVQAAIHFAANEWGVPEANMWKVAWPESGWLASNGNRGHKGLFAQALRYWRGRVAAFNAHVRLHNQRHPEQPLAEMAGDIFAPIDNARLSAAQMRGVLPGSRPGYGPWRASMRCHGLR